MVIRHGKIAVLEPGRVVNIVGVVVPEGEVGAPESTSVRELLGDTCLKCIVAAIGFVAEFRQSGVAQKECACRGPRAHIQNSVIRTQYEGIYVDQCSESMGTAAHVIDFRDR